MEWLKPLWKARLSMFVKKNLPKTSKSGMVPPTAPQTIALFPIFLPKTSSPTAAPNTICVSESIAQI